MSEQTLGHIPQSIVHDEETPEIEGIELRAAQMDAAAARREQEVRDLVLKTQVLGTMIDAGISLGWPMASMQVLLRAVLDRLGFSPKNIGPKK